MKKLSMKQPRPQTSWIVLTALIVWSVGLRCCFFALCPCCTPVVDVEESASGCCAVASEQQNPGDQLSPIVAASATIITGELCECAQRRSDVTPVVVEPIIVEPNSVYLTVSDDLTTAIVASVTTTPSRFFTYLPPERAPPPATGLSS